MKYSISTGILLFSTLALSIPLQTRNSNLIAREDISSVEGANEKRAIADIDITASVLNLTTHAAVVVGKDLSNINTQYPDLPSPEVLTGEKPPVTLPAVSKRDLSLPVDLPSVSVITTAISDLTQNVETELEVIKSLVSSTLTTSEVPEVEAALAIIVGQLNSTASTLSTVATSGDVSAAISQVDGLVTSLTELLSLVNETQLTLESLISNSSTEILQLLSPDISSVVALLDPLVSPTLGFATNLINTLSNDPDASAKLLGVVGQIYDVVNDLLSPVDGLTTQILNVCITCTLRSVLSGI